MAGNPAWLSVRDAIDEIREQQSPTTVWRSDHGRARSGPAHPRDEAGVHYGALHAPPLGDVVDLRRQQAQFAQTTRDLDWQNGWLAIPALAALALPAADAMAVLGLRAAAGAVLPKKPLALSELEPWQRNSRPPGPPLGGNAKTSIRERARQIVARTDGVQASELGAHVHHSEPLELAHLKPGADPNRRANLWPLSPEAHAIATREWGAFKRSLNGRTPSQAEVMKAKLRIDGMVAPYLRRRGVTISRLPPKRPSR